jgi:hypothetical protein
MFFAPGQPDFIACKTCNMNRIPFQVEIGFIYPQQCSIFQTGDNIHPRIRHKSCW